MLPSSGPTAPPKCCICEELRNFSFLDADATIACHVNELPHYLAVADGTDIDEVEEKVQWWARHERTLPNLSDVVHRLLLVQPSSASAERVFSLMQHFFSSAGKCTWGNCRSICFAALQWQTEQKDPVIHHCGHRYEYDNHWICTWFQVLFVLRCLVNNENRHYASYIF